MRTVDERLAFVEGRVVEQGQMHVELRTAIGDLGTRVTGLETRIDRRFDAVDRRFDAVDHRFDAVDRRFEAVDRRLEAIESRFDGLNQKMDRGFAALDLKLDQRFTWMVGIQLTTLVTIVAAVVAGALAR